jgi:DNA-binding CsgD family transcriptional regulator
MVYSFGANVEAEWQNPACRAAVGRLARNRRVVVVSRRGFGPSQRHIETLSLQDQVSDVTAVVDALRLDEFFLWGFLDAVGPCVKFAAENPERTKGLLLWDAYTHGPAMVSESQNRGMLELIHTNWNLATRAIADIALPGGPIVDQRWLARMFREAFSPEVAALYWQFMATVDLRPYLPRIKAPTLVLQRRGDRTVPTENVKAVAAMIPEARFLSLDGDIAYSWLGDTSYLSEVEAFLDAGAQAAQPEHQQEAHLSAREVEVLRLLATGRTNQEIADALVISLNTVSHHVTSILNKTGLTNRTEAAAYAHRYGLTDAKSLNR